MSSTRKLFWLGRYVDGQICSISILVIKILQQITHTWKLIFTQYVAYLSQWEAQNTNLAQYFSGIKRHFWKNAAFWALKYERSNWSGHSRRAADKANNQKIQWKIPFIRCLSKAGISIYMNLENGLKYILMLLKLTQHNTECLYTVQFMSCGQQYWYMHCSCANFQAILLS